MDSPLFLIEYEGREVLALDTGLQGHSFAQAKFGGLLAEHGAIFHPDGSMSPWVPEGTLERDGVVAIYGPAFRGTSPAQTGDGEASWQRYRLWLALQERIRAASGSLALSPSPLACLIDEKSSAALVFPAQPFHRAMMARKTEFEAFDRWLHPSLADEEAVVGTAALLAYRILTGTDPWPGTDGEELRQRMRSARPLPARYAHPGLQDGLSSLLDAALQSPGSEKHRKAPPRPSLARFKDAILAPGMEALSALYAAPDEETLESLVAERSSFEKRRSASERRRRFFHRHTKALVIGGIAVLALGIFTWDMVKTARSRPNTLGLEPEAVVEMYYGGFTPLDHEQMEGCLAKGAPKADIGAVMNYYVISRMRQGTERRTIANDPIPALEAGLDPQGFVFGTSDLVIAKLNRPDGDEGISTRPQFLVRYVLWYPGEVPMPVQGEDFPEPDSQAASFERRSDRVTLAWKKDRWLITDIDRRVEELSQEGE